MPAFTATPDGTLANRTMSDLRKHGLIVLNYQSHAPYYAMSAPIAVATQFVPTTPIVQATPIVRATPIATRSVIMPQTCPGFQVQFAPAIMYQTHRDLGLQHNHVLGVQSPYMNANNSVPYCARTTVAASSPSQRKEKQVRTLNSVAVAQEQASSLHAIPAQSQLDASSKSAPSEGLDLLAAAADLKRRCSKCGTSFTPKWRYEGTLCNGCGLRKYRQSLA